MRNLFNKNIYTEWKVIRTIWPYPEGYGIYRKNKLTGVVTSLDHGLTKDEAQRSADRMNGRKID